MTTQICTPAVMVSQIHGLVNDSTLIRFPKGYPSSDGNATYIMN